MPEKLGNPARFISLNHSEAKLASNLAVPSLRQRSLVLMIFLKSWCAGRRRAMFSTWHISPKIAYKEEIFQDYKEFLFLFFLFFKKEQGVFFFNINESLNPQIKHKTLTLLPKTDCSSICFLELF